MIKKIKIYFPDVVFGSIDGVVTTFAVIAGVFGASLSASLIFILGAANLFADGFSMGVSNYLSNDSKTIGVDEQKNSILSGVVTFFSFLIFGSIPLIPFLFYVWQDKNITSLTYLISFCISLALFFVLGVLKGIVTQKSIIKTGFVTFLIGAAASSIAFTVGNLLSEII